MLEISVKKIREQFLKTFIWSVVLWRCENQIVEISERKNLEAFESDTVLNVNNRRNRKNYLLKFAYRSFFWTIKNELFLRC